ncbi:DUF456 domain-containing protein [Clostridium sp. D2Q-11]|uniref:DUF456 domain-containing protein n=1 Tax=Anaeromonas frigoriresistens TaxID=2683708 RepID=A0A942Z807_9FIRM|nr:DUF456 domain-containing protein [Anaeromonas frigoriresistens]MBS4537803.1 DUF456 domain-containing protein [Anaeromonas frigoriresistens]
MNIILVIISLIIMFIGFIGTFLPAIPGPGLIFFTGLFYGIITGFEHIAVITIVILGILAILTIILDNVTSLITTKKVGASKYGIIGAIVGGIIGFLSLSFIGLIIGQFIGAIVGELLIKKQFKDSFKVGIATFIGYLIGVVLNSTIALIMIVIFVFDVII